ncbi:MJ1255/VC2487 family glycosyltransferase [Kaarinaea lacus]
MAKIVYGVSGEGSGHSSRAREMLTHLLAQGHEVKVASYDRGYRNLRKDFDVTEITGLTIVSEDNRVSPIRTLLRNLKGIPEGLKSFRHTRRALFNAFQPDCVITDFEPSTAYLANYYDIPLITIDNQHRMRYMDYECPDEFRKDALITEAVIRAMVPRPTVSLITTFHFGELLNRRSFLFPPILRQSIFNLQPSQGEHILVYLTSGFDSMLEQLPHFSREKFLVYGYNRDSVEGNLQFRPFSQDGFLRDLASTKAVVATAGFTLLTESLYLAKPYLALPMQGQFEQVLNAIMLAKSGYGQCAFAPDKNIVAAFLYHLPDYQSALASYPREANVEIKSFLDELLENNCALLNKYHQERDAD